MKEWVMLEGNWMETNYDAAGMELNGSGWNESEWNGIEMVLEWRIQRNQ